jgi:hypothetical protein
MAEEFEIAIFMCLVGLVVYVLCKMTDPGVASVGSLGRRIINIIYRGLRWLVIPLLCTVFLHPTLGLTVFGFNIVYLIVRTIEERNR